MAVKKEKQIQLTEVLKNSKAACTFLKKAFDNEGING